MGHGKPRSQRGRPLIADARAGKRALDRIRRLSKPFGVNVEMENGVGIVQI